MATSPPHGPCLHSDFEKAPASPLPSNFRPLDGVEYKVASGDSFASLAAFASMNAWDLIRFNYQTSNPCEVNWYLHHRTGCKTQDWDFQNFKFDDSDEPGVIFIPKSAYKRMIEAGVKPKKFFSEADTFRVPGHVRTFSQGLLDRTCWAVASSAMICWKRFHLTTLPEALESVGAKWLKKFEDNIALSDPDMHAFTAAAGLHRGGLLDTQDLWIWALRNFGPLMVIQTSAPGYVHWILVTGYEIIPPLTLRLHYTESANGSKRTKDWESIANEAKRAEGSLPAMYYWH